ncbi:hypothetical protein FLL45_15770 [Aliikangiella marina]|uniref:PRC-barrel domain-containing protein n=1 Tax=Aliikangiella marina TaxID=1712262 RepID=A0A545T6X0_9GAMM|nr:PRC-barrel domain-containing protein [Aliikangiella marina]TQV72922.1 hypothetical protein FLL45_15770 [Aliikangiella marina]
MSEPKLIIVDNLKQIVAWTKFGVMWRNETHERLGSFYDNVICDNDDKQIAYIKGCEVFSMAGEMLGQVKDIVVTTDDGLELNRKSLIFNGRAVGVSSGDTLVGLAALVFLGKELSAQKGVED